MHTIKRRTLLFVIVALLSTGICRAQSDTDRLLSKARNQVVALRVYGDIAPTAQFPKGEPPIWGTGFVVGPLDAKVDGKQRIITAGHVVQKDEMWAMRGGGPARTVYPWVLGQAGRTQIEGFRGVMVHSASDIAQVQGPRKLEPVVIRSEALEASKRYFVVSWGLDDAWGEPTEEPYIKEVKVVAQTPSDPPVEAGLALVEVVNGQKVGIFKESESGSPVFNLAGEAVAIMIRKRVDASSGLATRGIALPFAELKTWLDGVRKDPVKEPLLVDLSIPKDALPPSEDDFASAKGGCVFLGKYSARNKVPDSIQARSNAPVGVDFLRKVVNLFPEANPDRVLDRDAVVTKEFSTSVLVSVVGSGAVNIRGHCPNVVPKPRRAKDWERKAYYGPIIARADRSVQFRIKAVQRQAYLEDFFYWGQVERVSPR
jgi:hypothetical protein